MPHVQQTQTYINIYGYCNVSLYHEIIETHNYTLR